MCDPSHRVARLCTACCFLICAWFMVAGSLALAEPTGNDVLSTAIAGPLAGVDEVVFAMRQRGQDPHWYANFGYWCPDPSKKMYADGGRLCRLNLRTGELKLLIDDPEGGVRDPQVHYDGKKILFSYRRGGQPFFHLYEINVDGTGLRQLTEGDFDDIEPTYLPDGDIIFCSSRCRRYVNCWYTHVATLHRCDANGQHIRMVSSNNDHDNTPWVLPDGRILYMRWEYVDRSQVHFHHLWTINPDGTSQMVYYGNEKGGIAMLDAKPIPGTEKIVASFSPGHGVNEHLGYVTVVDPRGGPDVESTARQVSRGGRMFRDPYAVSEACFLVADGQGVYVMDGDGDLASVYKHRKEDGSLEPHEPQPVRARPREPVIPSRVDPTKETGELVLADVTAGRNMTGVERGEIKKLLVLEQLPEPVHFSGGMEPLTMGGSFTLARILGTVPVEPDGSAYMELPAMRSLFFVALDKDDLAVKRMQSFVTLQPGERTSCIGCHEQRTRTTSFERHAMSALSRAPSRIEPITDAPDVLDFPRDIQPILDAHCVSCHNPDRREGDVELVGDHAPAYSIAYATLFERGLVADGRNQPYGNRAPRTIGSSASRLLKLMDGSHHGARPSERERKVVRLWIESSAPYPGTYAALGCGMYYPTPWPARLLEKRCGECHGDKQQDGKPERKAFRFGRRSYESLVNLTHPDKSLLLRAPLNAEHGGLSACSRAVFADKSDADYGKLLAGIRAAADQLKTHKRFDMPGFVPNEHYLREMRRYGILGTNDDERQNVDYYALDRAYWQTFWYRPQSKPVDGLRR